MRGDCGKQIGGGCRWVVERGGKMEYILSIKSCAVKNIRPNFVVLEGAFR